MEVIHARGADYTVARASREDVPALVELLADDVLGAGREHDRLEPYLEAFERIDTDANHYLAVVRDEDGTAVGTCQLSIIPGLSHGGTTRLLVEAVRVAASERNHGLGTAMLEWAHEHGRRHGATLVELTTNQQRTDAHRFYERLGYAATHRGFKRTL